MIVHLKYNSIDSKLRAIEVTLDDASPKIIELVNLKGHFTIGVEKDKPYFELFYDTDNIDINKWDIHIEPLKEFFTSLVNLTKPYLREHKLKNLIDDKDN